ARGLVEAELVPSLEELLVAAGGTCLTLNALSWSAATATAERRSHLEEELLAYRAQLDLWLNLLEPLLQEPDGPLVPPTAEVIPTALALLQSERRLLRQIAPRSWPTPPWRPPLDAAGWIRADVPLSPEQADQLAALVHLLPQHEQAAFTAALASDLEALLRQAGPEATAPEQACGLDWVWDLAETLVGALNSRDPELSAIACKLRGRMLERALQLPDPVQRAARLIRCIDSETCSSEATTAVATLAAAIDSVVQEIDLASSRGDGKRRRLLQRQLAEAVRGAGSNLQLLRELVLQLSLESCSQLPQRQPPSACLLLLKGLLLLDGAAVTLLPLQRQKALVQLFERLLPRVWWQADLLAALLRDLRRFRLDVSWLSSHGGAVLAGTMRLHRYLVPPTETAGQPGADSEAQGQELLRLQLLALLRLTSGVRDRTNLLLRVQEMTPGDTSRCWLAGAEEPLLAAACSGFGTYTTSLLRLYGEACGVPDLMPLLPPGEGVAQAFDRILEHWRRHGPQPGSAAPGAVRIAVVITTFRPDLGRLRQALEALRLQTLPPAEVLVVDDGSPAAEGEALEQLLDLFRYGHGLPVLLLRRERNQGQYSCRNLALAACRSEVLAIQDDDDLSHPLRLEHQARALAQGALACYCQHVRFEELSGQPQPDGDGFRAIGDGITSLIVRRDTAVALGGFYPVRSRGDVEFRSRLQRQFGEGAIARLGQPLYLMRGGAGTISSGFEYGCSLRMSTWRRLIRREHLV
ncbi:glycosyltransferase family 2 protein, partial [Cyanobium sp. LEGE 06143]|uniref:glycosyltransferase family 2 protein n=1 Tax=Cyanobium sp. LEGE 06143 TaxID=945727 RepID=UPI001D144A23